jgi:wyosine [tRNA(Phe)-imidazoG37] synthetase (radical SAM superfamily)
MIQQTQHGNQHQQFLNVISKMDDTFLFSDLIFGPIKSRRLGHSLGINVLPTASKFCNFDCIYCECGWTHNNINTALNLPAPDDIVQQLIKKATALRKERIEIDNITFAGNGEPTLHPKFEQIVSDVILVRNLLLPESKISVLTNATMLHKQSVKSGLAKVDTCMFKLDAGTEELFQQINQPLGGLTLEKIKKQLKEVTRDIVIQSMFFKGNYKGHEIDNTATHEVEAWVQHILDIKPKSVMLYSINRATPAKGLKAVSKAELTKIGSHLKQYDIEAQIV